MITLDNIMQTTVLIALRIIKVFAMRIRQSLGLTFVVTLSNFTNLLHV